MSAELRVDGVKGGNHKGGGIYAKLSVASQDGSLWLTEGEKPACCYQTLHLCPRSCNPIELIVGSILFIFLIISLQCIAVSISVLVSSLARHERQVSLRSSLLVCLRDAQSATGHF